MRLTHQSGFSLVEVMLATLVLSVGLVTIYRPLLSALDAVEYGDARLEMNRLISNQICEWEQIVFQTGRPMTNQKGGLIGSKKAFQYYADIKSIDSNPILQHAKVTMTWEGLGRKKQATRDFYVGGTPFETTA